MEKGLVDPLNSSRGVPIACSVDNGCGAFSDRGPVVSQTFDRHMDAFGPIGIDLSRLALQSR